MSREAKPEELLEIVRIAVEKATSSLIGSHSIGPETKEVIAALVKKCISELRLQKLLPEDPWELAKLLCQQQGLRMEDDGSLYSEEKCIGKVIRDSVKFEPSVHNNGGGNFSVSPFQYELHTLYAVKHIPIRLVLDETPTPTPKQRPTNYAEFTKAFGRTPIDDELHRILCTRVGEIGHTQCGWCDPHQTARFECGCRAETTL